LVELFESRFSDPLRECPHGPTVRNNVAVAVTKVGRPDSMRLGYTDSERSNKNKKRHLGISKECFGAWDGSESPMKQDVQCCRYVAGLARSLEAESERRLKPAAMDVSDGSWSQ
jgi:hypothetical protein